MKFSHAEWMALCSGLNVLIVPLYSMINYHAYHIIQRFWQKYDAFHDDMGKEILIFYWFIIHHCTPYFSNNKAINPIHFYLTSIFVRNKKNRTIQPIISLNYISFSFTGTWNLVTENGVHCVVGYFYAEGYSSLGQRYVLIYSIEVLTVKRLGHFFSKWYFTL